MTELTKGTVLYRALLRTARTTFSHDVAAYNGMRPANGSSTLPETYKLEVVHFLRLLTRCNSCSPEAAQRIHVD